MTDEYLPALLLDMLVVVVCVVSLVKLAKIRFSHPATPYIAFHLHTVTVRLAGLMNGAVPLYGGSAWFEEVLPVEIKRAALYCDFAFVVVTIIWIALARRHVAPPRKAADERIMLDQRVLRPILVVAFVGGLVGLRVAAQIPGITVFEGFSPESAWSTTSYLWILPTWFGLSVLGHAYYNGFKRVSLVLLAFYLGVMSLQGGSRFRVIIGLLLAVQIYLERKNLRWPGRKMVGALAVAAVLFFPMKQIGILIQTGGDMDAISDTFSESVRGASTGKASDQMFLDEFASALTLLDANGQMYMGSIYLPLLTLPIPRALWPNKPGLAGFVSDISTQSRPMYASGMITTYLGEAYANFGLAGIFVLPPILALFLGIFHERARAAPYHSIFRFSYVLLSVNLIQVYRDGLQSIVLFTFVNMLPLTVIVIAHIVYSLVYRRPPVVAPARPVLPLVGPELGGHATPRDVA